MNDCGIDCDDFHPINGQCDQDDPVELINNLQNQNQQHFNIIQEVKLRIEFEKSSDNYGPDCYQAINIETNEQFIISKQELTNDTKALIENNLELNKEFKNKSITSILEIRTHEIRDNYVFIFYKFFKCTLRKHMKERITEDNFKYLLRRLFKAIDLIHEENSVLGNISLDTFSVVDENKKLKSKIFDLSKAKKSSITEEFTKDKKAVGILILSMFTSDEEAQKIANNFDKSITYNDKFDPIYKKVKHTKWIKRSNIKNLADLIACLLNAKSTDSLRDFNRHVFFFNRQQTLDFLCAINGRLNVSQDERGKNKGRCEIVKKRNKVLQKLKPEDATVKDKLLGLLGVFAPKDATLAERSRETRNKEVHLDDETEEENEGEDGNQGCDMKEQIQNILSKKDPEAWKIISKFFRKKGGPINVHLEADEDFIYDLFNSVRILAFNPKIKKFYLDSFLFENSNDSYEKILAGIESEELANKLDDQVSLENISKGIKAPIKKGPDVSSNQRNDNFREQDKFSATVKAHNNLKKGENKPEAVTVQHTGGANRRTSTISHQSSNCSQQIFRNPQERQPHVGYSGLGRDQSNQNWIQQQPSSSYQATNYSDPNYGPYLGNPMNQQQYWQYTQQYGYPNQQFVNQNQPYGFQSQSALKNVQQNTPQDKNKKLYDISRGGK